MPSLFLSLIETLVERGLGWMMTFLAKPGRCHLGLTNATWLLFFFDPINALDWNPCFFDKKTCRFYKGRLKNFRSNLVRYHLYPSGDHPKAETRQRGNDMMRHVDVDNMDFQIHHLPSSQEIWLFLHEPHRLKLNLATRAATSFKGENMLPYLVNTPAL